MSIEVFPCTLSYPYPHPSTLLLQHWITRPFSPLIFDSHRSGLVGDQDSADQMKGGDDVCPENGNIKADKVWETFQKSFSQVQTILDQNRVLIREINQNHESKIPENLTRNVALIRELNRNIARVVELYANLSSEFVQSMSGNTMEEEAANLMKTDTDGSNSPPSTGQKKPRHG